jgi:trimeric autotransporter adhesin
MAFFGVTSQDKYYQPIIGFSTNLLYGVYDARAMVNAARQIPKDQIDALINNKPAVQAPWEIATEPKSLISRIGDVRNLTSFINLKSPDVAIGESLDKQATFAIFKALDNIRTLAQYAAEKTTPNASLSRLDNTFQLGLSEVRQFLSQTTLDKLDLLLGAKSPRMESAVKTGKASTTYVGSTVTALTTDLVAGVAGTEVFTIALTKNGVTDNITVDLGTMGATPLTLDNIVAHINTQIEALPLLDEFGAPILDEFGAPVAKYLTRFETAANADATGFTMKIAGISTESVKLSAAVTAPALYVTGTHSSTTNTDASTALLTKITNTAGVMVEGTTTQFAGIDRDASAIKLATSAVDPNAGLDPKIAELKAKMLADSALAVKATAVEVATVDLTDITALSDPNIVASQTTSSRVAVDSEGNAYVVGNSTGSFGNHINIASTNDVFLTKFDSQGNVVFSKLLGTSDDASGFAIAIDSADNVIIAGQTNTSLVSTDVIKGQDTFVSKFNARGDQLFTYQLDGAATTTGLSLTVDATDDIIVGGQAMGNISATSTYAGAGDGLLLKISGATGTLAASNVFGTAASETIKAVDIAADGNVVVAMEINGDAVVKKFSAADLTTEIFSINLGALTNGSIEGMVIDGANIYVTGVTQNAALDSAGTATIIGAAAGGSDGFVAGFSDGGSSVSANFVTYIGTAGTDSIADITVNAGKVFVAGSTSSILGAAQVGGTDGFVARIDGVTGIVEDTQQFGAYLSNTKISGVAFTAAGDSVLSKLGLPLGTVKADATYDIQSQTNARAGDYFYISFDGGAKKKITIDDGDTFDDIARKIRVIGFGKVEVTVADSAQGKQLKISSLSNGVPVELFAGKGDQDALARLGMEPARLIPSNILFNINPQAEKYSKADLGGVFALNIDGALHIQDKTTAQYAIGILDKAITEIQRASRSLIYDPVKAALLRKGERTGTVSTYLTNKISNYQDALYRLQASSYNSNNGGYY